MSSLQVIHEDNHLLIVNKPASIPTMGVAAGQESVLENAKTYLKRKYNKPGNVYLGVVSRLDAPVTGVLLMARTSKAASRLSRQFRDRDVKKIYYAVVEGNPEAEGRCHHWLRKDERHRRMHVTQKDVETAQEARLEYRRIRRLRGDLSLLEVKLLTGRKHQIRVQLSAIKCPIVGDRKYKSSRTFPSGIALHARTLEFTHPVGQRPMRVSAELPSAWRQTFGRALEGEAGFEPQ